MDNPNRMITKQDLAEFYDTIYPYLGGMPEALVSKFNKSDLYSTSEKVIGCWIDGRPLYQKSISCGALPNATTKTVAHNISNLREVVLIRGWVSSNGTGDSATFSPIPFVSNGNTTSTNASVACLVYQGYVHLTSFIDLTAFNNCYVTLNYTKSTDSANSFNYGDENDYSTTEKIVGTWIDSKPIYQKTFDMGALPSSSGNKDVTHGLSIDTLVSAKASLIQKTGTAFTTGVSSNFYGTGTSTNNVIEDTMVLIVKNDVVRINVKKDRSNFVAYVTLQYTKA